MDVLCTWVGARDPKWHNDRSNRTEPGPILSLLQTRKFGVVYLLFNLHSRTDDFRQKSARVQRICAQMWPDVDVRQMPIDVASVTDYTELFLATQLAIQEVLDKSAKSDRYFAFLSPGTPQMQTVWVLLVQAGIFPATMIETSPLDLRWPGAPAWREVNVKIGHIFESVRPARRSQRERFLEGQNRELRLQLESLVSIGNHGVRTNPLDVNLREHLRDVERAYYSAALVEAQGNASRAARLLQVEPAAFRARASSLGLRSRRRKTDAS